MDQAVVLHNGERIDKTLLLQYTRAMTDTYLQVRIDPQMKAEAESVFSSLGLTATQAVKLFFRQVALRQAIPFALTLTPPIGVSEEEEAMIALSLEDVKKGKVTVVDMSNVKQIAKLFEV